MTKRSEKTTDHTNEERSGAAQGWLLQSPPGLASWLKREMVFAGALERKQDLFIKKQRNHDLLFASRLKNGDAVEKLRMAEMALQCPVYGRFKISKRQLDTMAEVLKSTGTRRLVVSVTGRVFQRQDLLRFLSRALEERGYEFEQECEDEVWMFCVDEAFYFGLPVIKARDTEGREDRVSEREGSLPPPIAAAMAFAGMVRNDDVVLDPTCGSGSLLMEARAYAQDAKLIGVDIDPSAIKVARENTSTSEISLISGDITSDLVFDKISEATPEGMSVLLANLPFGKQFGEKKTNAALYASILERAKRLARSRKWRAVLLTSDRDSMAEALRGHTDLKHEIAFQVKVRGVVAAAYRIDPR